MDDDLIPVVAYPQKYMDTLYQDVADTKAKLDCGKLHIDDGIEAFLAHLNES